MSKIASTSSPIIRIVVLVSALILLAEGFGYVWVRSQYHLTIKAIAAEKGIHRQLSKTGKQLKVERALLKSPRELARRAREELGLRRPTPNQILHIR